MTEPKVRYSKTCKRWNLPGDAHELTFCCYDKRRFLNTELACRMLAEAIDTARAKHCFDLWAYVFMPEHVHMLIWPREPSYSISRILQSIKQPVSRRHLNHLREDDPGGIERMWTGRRDAPYRFWQDGGGYDRNINDPETVLFVVNYIHANPVRRELVDHPEKWPWSSYGDWEGTPPGLLRIDRESFPMP